MTGYKFWRVINISTRTNTFNSRNAAELRFIGENQEISDNPAKAFAYSEPDNGLEGPAKAFDGNPNTLAHNYYPEDPLEAYKYYLGYEFTDPVVVNRIHVQMRQNMSPDWGQEWQTAEIECSNDGISWQYYGFISPKIQSMNLSLIETPVYSLYNLNATIFKQGKRLNLFSIDESGSFSGKVTQGESGQPKIPLKAEVLLYDRLTNSLLQRTWSDELGAYSFNGLDAGREYYAATLHPSRTYNAAIQDGLTSGMTA